jgi:hypothetical protein
VGTAHTTKSTRPHPLLARLMRERLREHSRHLEAQHREAGGDSGSDSDDDARDATGDVAGTSREASPSNDADDESIVDDFDLHEDDEGGAFDSDAGAGRDDVATNRSIRAAAATPEGRRLVDLVRLESMALDDAIASGASPSQRRVNALLRMERRAKAEAERGRGGNPGRRAAGETRSTGSFSASFARRANPDAQAGGALELFGFRGELLRAHTGLARHPAGVRRFKRRRDTSYAFPGGGAHLRKGRVSFVRQALLGEEEITRSRPG